ncbi:response regulator [Desulfatibacillum aliphaticivorans]|uniref:response regulator n=1 Tax=Desulfatibacillum aliphaticivorans TaxID=218208 RepID=UPI0006884602|nr:response regulator [Desulfatibacillum aliphaticivorans]
MKCETIKPVDMDSLSAVSCRQGAGCKQQKSGFQPTRCLVVDDDFTIIEYVVQLLELLGFLRVETAQGQPDVMNKLTAGSYELLITDLEMPDMNGYHLTQTVKQDAPDTKTIIMTGRHKAYCRAMMASWWVDGWLFKPFKLKELRSMLSLLGLLKT